MKISRKAAAVAPSSTLAVAAKAKKLRAEGVDIISFSAGEPDFDTPEKVREQGKLAIDKGYTRYTPTSGALDLRLAVARKIKRDYGFEVETDEIVVNSGAKHSIFLALAGLLDPGDEVIIPSPYWVSYPVQVRLNDGVPVIVETYAEERFRLTPEKLKAAITPNTRVLILNSPSNPTGMIYGRGELEGLAEVVVENDLSVISDDIYEKLIYDGLSFTSISQVSEELRARTVIVNGVSKCAAMTGWRIGYAVADRTLIQAMTRIQGQSTSHPDSIAQYASLEAVLGDEWLPGWVAEFEKRRNRMVELLNEISGVTCLKPDGAFYAFADFRELLSRGPGGRELKNDLDLADYLIDEAGVACVPGSGFGAEGFLRLSFATSMANIEEGVKRIRESVEKP